MVDNARGGAEGGGGGASGAEEERLTMMRVFKRVFARITTQNVFRRSNILT
jgi:hypothetical protein